MNSTNPESQNPYSQYGLVALEDPLEQESLIRNYKLFKAALTADEILKDEILTMKANTLFDSDGYFIGKDLLIKILQEDFAEYDMLEIRFVVPGNVISDDSSGQMALLFRGAFPTSEETVELSDSTDGKNPRFASVSSKAYWAGNYLSQTTPDPDVLKNPPYGVTDDE